MVKEIVPQNQVFIKHSNIFDKQIKLAFSVSNSIDNSAEKDIENLPKDAVRRVAKVIDKLANDPRPSGVKKLKASDENLYRVKNGDYRIVYEIADEIRILNIRRIRHRKDVYRNL